MDVSDGCVWCTDSCVGLGGSDALEQELILVSFEELALVPDGLPTIICLAGGVDETFEED